MLVINSSSGSGKLLIIFKPICLLVEKPVAMGNSMRTGSRPLLPEAMLVEIIARLPLGSIASSSRCAKHGNL